MENNKSIFKVVSKSFDYDINKIQFNLNNLSPEEETCYLICYALQEAGYKLPQGMFDSPHLALLDFLTTNEEVDKFYSITAPLLYKFHSMNKREYPKYSVPKVLVEAVNLWLKQTVIEFDENTKPITILNELLSMRPVLVIDMDHHLSIVNGFEYELDKSIDLEETADIIYETNPSRINILSRKEQSSIDYAFFIKSIKPLSSATDKWVFTIKKPTAII